MGKLYSLCFSMIFFGLKAQVLHRQTLSSQGVNVLTKSGFVLSQSIGQNSPSGTFENSEIVVQQGFQQYIINRQNINKNDIVVKVYPNPFVSYLNFEFLQSPNDDIQVSLFDLSGKLVKTVYGKSLDNIFKVDFEDVLDGHYIVVLNVGSSKISAKIIKINKL